MPYQKIASFATEAETMEHIEFRYSASLAKFDRAEIITNEHKKHILVIYRGEDCTYHGVENIAEGKWIFFGGIVLMART